MTHFILALDQGTTSSRAIVYDAQIQPIASHALEFTQIFPQSGWVEHDPMEIWQTSLTSAQKAIEKADINPSQIASIGITNQRETCLLWNKETGKPLGNAIVWQDRRTAEFCDKLKKDQLEPMLSAKTGLLLDPYFSATKLKWMLDLYDPDRSQSMKGKLAFGTIDSWLLWHLTGQKHHLTDATNASRTLLYDIHKGQWDEELCRLFNVPMALLPTVKNCADEFGTTDPALFGAPIPVHGCAGDQQAATIGQACFAPGMLKSTYGTGCFAMLNIGQTPVPSQNRLLTTICYQLNDQPTYALEGSIFIAGAGVGWLRDQLQIITKASECDDLAKTANDDEVMMVPAFTGLGAPWWDPHARGALYGLTRNSGRNEIVRACLEAAAFQTRDLLEAMNNDWGQKLDDDLIVRTDGGMAASNYTMQFLADIIPAQVERSQYLETTARGAAYLAGLKIGLYPDLKAFSKLWQYDKRFRPQMSATSRTHKWTLWQNAIRRTKSPS